MKIISEIPDKSSSGSYLVKITKGELEKILGMKYGELKYEDIKIAITEEQDLKVSQIYDQYHQFKNHINRLEYHSARNKLQEMLNDLTPIQELINKTPTEFTEQ